MLLPQLIAGPTDLSVFANMEIPSWDEVPVTLEEARQAQRIGGFVPTVIPEGFTFDWGTHSHTPHQNKLYLQWHGTEQWEFLNIQIFRVTSPFFATSVDDRAAFDWSLYPYRFSEEFQAMHYSELDLIPWTIWHPFFAAEDLNLDVIKARAYWSGPESNYQIWTMPIDFGVLHEDVMVRISAYGVSAEALWEMLRPGYIAPIFPVD